MEKIRYADSVESEVVHRGKEERDKLYAVNRGKANWIGQIFDNREHKRDRKTERCAVDYVALLVNALSS
jgi:hypothetical protein